MVDKAKELNSVIRSSDEYIKYQNAKREIMENEELYHAMNAFRKRNYELQSSEDGMNHYEESWNLTREYEKILLHPLVNQFLVSEQILSKKLATVYEVIAEDLELDYDYME